MIRVALDLAMMRPGVGGTGSGIWTYASTLLKEISESAPDDIELCCLIQRDLIGSMSNHRNIRFVAVPRFGKNIVLRLLWNHLILPLLCICKRIDVLHKPATETPLLLPCRCVTTIHDFYYNFLFESEYSQRASLRVRLESIYLNAMQRHSIRRSDALITVSETIKKEAVKRYPDSDSKIHVIHHGVPLGFGSARTDTEKEDSDTFSFLYLAKFMPYKGQHLALDALRALIEEHPSLSRSVRLCLRGFENDRDYFESIVDEVAALNEAGCLVEILPYDARKDLGDLYRDFDALLFLSAYEGFGLPLIEAQQMGLPVLCSDIPVLREVGGEGAIYVDRNDPAAIAARMRELIEDKNLYTETIRRGRDNLQRFSWEKSVRKTLDVYRQLECPKRTGLALWRAATIAYMALVVSASLLPIGLGSAGGIPHIDKLAHLLMYMGMAFLLCRSFNADKSPARRRLIALGYAVVFGVLMEVFQYAFAPSRSFSLADIIANTLGAGIGTLTLRKQWNLVSAKQ